MSYIWPWIKQVSIPGWLWLFHHVTFKARVVIETVVPVGQGEVIWSSAQNLTAITDGNTHNFSSSLVNAQLCHINPKSTDERFARKHKLKKKNQQKCMHVHQLSGQTPENLLTQASDLLTWPPLARFSKLIQVAFISHTGHSVSWATAPHRYNYYYTEVHCCGHLCTSAAGVTALATGTFNTVATWTTGSSYTVAVNATFIPG